MRKGFIGVDNGYQGGLAYVSEEYVEVHPMPTLKLGTKRILDEPAIYALLERWSHIEERTVAAIEVVQAMPKNGSVAMCNYGCGHGIVRGICVGIRVPYTLIHPKTWQKAMLDGLSKTDTKSMSILVAQRMYPLVSLRLTASSKPLDGLSDALLLASYARRIGL